MSIEFDMLVLLNTLTESDVKLESSTYTLLFTCLRKRKKDD